MVAIGRGTRKMQSSAESFRPALGSLGIFDTSKDIRGFLLLACGWARFPLPLSLLFLSSSACKILDFTTITTVHHYSFFLCIHTKNKRKHAAADTSSSFFLAVLLCQRTWCSNIMRRTINVAVLFVATAWCLAASVSSAPAVIAENEQPYYLRRVVGSSSLLQQPPPQLQQPPYPRNAFYVSRASVARRVKSSKDSSSSSRTTHNGGKSCKSSKSSKSSDTPAPIPAACLEQNEEGRGDDEDNEGEEDGGDEDSEDNGGGEDGGDEDDEDDDGQGGGGDDEDSDDDTGNMSPRDRSAALSCAKETALPTGAILSVKMDLSGIDLLDLPAIDMRRVLQQNTRFLQDEEQIGMVGITAGGETTRFAHFTYVVDVSGSTREPCGNPSAPSDRIIDCQIQAISNLNSKVRRVKWRPQTTLAKLTFSFLIFQRLPKLKWPSM
jgi:hypothetical protein